MAHTSNHYGVHGVSGSALLTAINAATEAVSGLFLVPVNNGNEIAVIGVN